MFFLGLSFSVQAQDKTASVPDEGAVEGGEVVIQENLVEEEKTMTLQAIGGAGILVPSTSENMSSQQGLSGFLGQEEVDLFSGALTYRYPIWVPKGRLGMEPLIYLQYSSFDRHFGSEVGLGWHLPRNSIYRVSRRGTDQLYTSDEFVADIFGRSEELILISENPRIYRSEVERTGGWREYRFSNNQWEVIDEKGTSYYFGTDEMSRQTNAEDASEVYQWHLQRIEDKRGNYMTFSYSHDAGVVYSDSVRYTGFGADEGIFEVRYLYGQRDAHVSYEPGFKTEHRRLLDQIEIWSFESGESRLVRTYDLGHERVNEAIYRLKDIYVRSGESVLNPTTFSYFDQAGSEGRLHALREVKTPLGGRYKFEYRPTTWDRDALGELTTHLPFVAHVVARVGVQAGEESDFNFTRYDYEAGHYFYDVQNAFLREFVGFGRVTLTDPLGNEKHFSFHQSEGSVDGSDEGEYEDHRHKKGHIYREIQYDDQGKVYRDIVRKWDRFSLPRSEGDRERSLVFLAQEVTTDYDGNSTGKHRAQLFEYTSEGLLSRQTDLGEVQRMNPLGDYLDVEGDSVIEEIAYATDSTGSLSVFPYFKNRFGGTGQVLGKELFFYDDLEHGRVDKGDLTRYERLVTAEGEVVYLSEQAQYSPEGLLVRYVSPRGTEQRFVYGDEGLYPINEINALGHSKFYTYDLAFGVPTQITDANDVPQRVVLDRWGRVLQIQRANPLNGTDLLTAHEWLYEDYHFPTSILERSYPQVLDKSDKVLVFEKMSYLDGLGRVIQERHKTEGEDRFRVNGWAYDEVGNLKREYLPREGQGMGFDSEAFQGASHEYRYDPLNRMVRQGNALGVTRKIYDDWSQTIIDPLGNPKKYLFDARDQLVEVIEYLEEEELVTGYEYDGNGNIVLFQNAEGQIKTQQFDLLGRKRVESLWHKVGNVTPGLYLFEYDENGNMIEKRDPRGKTLSFSYDALDRALAQRDEGADRVLFSYRYDEGPFGKGRKTGVVGADFEKRWGYDALGRVKSELVILDGGEYQTFFSYDLVGNLMGITYPDGQQGTYYYTPEGRVERITQGNRVIISDIDYHLVGEAERTTYGNGIVVRDEFDEGQLYRLVSRKSEKDGVEIQRLVYEYDLLGNVLGVRESNQGEVVREDQYTYDDLSRLTTFDVGSGLRTIEYDRVGNILNRSDVGDFLYESLHPHAVSLAGPKSYRYDAAGNVIENGNWQHEWNSTGTLRRSSDGTTTLEYEYDDQGNRIKKTLLESEETSRVSDQVVISQYEVAQAGRSDQRENPRKLERGRLQWKIDLKEREKKRFKSRIERLDQKMKKSLAVRKKLQQYRTEGAKIQDFVGKKKRAGQRFASGERSMLKEDIRAQRERLKQLNLQIEEDTRIQLEEEFSPQELDKIKWEPNYLFALDQVTDPMWSSQWGVAQVIQHNEVNLEGASNRAPVVVAVLDAGVDFGHEDLVANQWEGEGCVLTSGGNDVCVGGYDFIDHDPDPFPSDHQVHGTAVAGVVGAVTGNEMGIVSVGGNQVQIMSVRVCCTTDGLIPLDALVNGVYYAVDNGANIINMSLGGPTYSEALRGAIEYAQSQGVMVVASAGNYGVDNDLEPTYLAGYDLPNILSVGAEDQSGQLPYFSNYGDESVDLVAPGVDILTTVLGNGYGMMDGTSFSSPMVTSVLAKWFGEGRAFVDFLAALPVNEALTSVVKEGKILRYGEPLVEEATSEALAVEVPPETVREEAVVESEATVFTEPTSEVVETTETILESPTTTVATDFLLPSIPDGVGTTTWYVNRYFEIEGTVVRHHVFVDQRRVATWESDGGLTVSGALEEAELIALAGQRTEEVPKRSGQKKRVRRNKKRSRAKESTFPTDSQTQVQSSEIAGAWVFYQADHLGGMNLVTDENGEVVQKMVYGPFGSVRSEIEGGYEGTYTFTDKEQDAGSEWFYFGARYYDSEVGRFMSIDPWEGDPTDPQSFNKYSYVGNNPLKYVDPNGEERISVIIEMPSMSIFESFYGKKGLSGHTGIALENEFYDYGPTYDYKGSPAAPWWDARYSENGNASLDDIMNRLNRIPNDTYRFDTEVTSEQFGKLKDYWDGLYADMGEYSIFGNQCTTTVDEGLVQAGILKPSGGWYESYSRMRPDGYFAYLKENLRNTWGEDKGRLASLSLLKRGKDSVSLK